MNLFSFFKSGNSLNSLRSSKCKKKCESKSKKSIQKSVNVCVFGGTSPIRIFTSLLLKQNPIVAGLHLYGECAVKNTALHLNQFDTRSKVHAYIDNDSLPKALRGADIILMLENEALSYGTTTADRILTEGQRIYNLSLECIKYAPKSIIVMAVPPISITTAIVEQVFRDTHWYHPSRIVGSAGFSQMKANSILGRHQAMDPHVCHVPIVGGPDIDVAVPVFSAASPVGALERESKGLLARFQDVAVEDFPKISARTDFVEPCHMSEAFALNRLITIIAMGICGDQAAVGCAYVRSNFVNVCQHLVSTVQFARGGVIHNYGVPCMSKLELKLFERAIRQIKEREQMAKDFVKYVKEKTEDNAQPPSFKLKELEELELLQQKVYP